MCQRRRRKPIEDLQTTTKEQQTYRDRDEPDTRYCYRQQKADQELRGVDQVAQVDHQLTQKQTESAAWTLYCSKSDWDWGCGRQSDHTQQVSGGGSPYQSLEPFEGKDHRAEQKSIVRKEAHQWSEKVDQKTGKAKRRHDTQARARYQVVRGLFRDLQEGLRWQSQASNEAGRIVWLPPQTGHEQQGCEIGCSARYW